MTQDANHGFYIQGVCKGYKNEPWSSDASKVNHYIGVGFLRDDDFGDMKEDTKRLSLYSDAEEVKRLGTQAKNAKGKLVKVPVIPIAKDGKKGAWLSYVVPKGADIQVIE